MAKDSRQVETVEVVAETLRPVADAVHKLISRAEAANRLSESAPVVPFDQNVILLLGQLQIRLQIIKYELRSRFGVGTDRSVNFKCHDKQMEFAVALIPELFNVVGKTSAECDDMIEKRELAPFRSARVLATFADALDTHILQCESSAAKVGDDLIESIGSDECKIIELLGRMSPRRLALYAIETETQISKKTAGRIVNDLIGNELAHRPKGTRNGVTLTPDGFDLFKRISR